MDLDLQRKLSQYAMVVNTISIFLKDHSMKVAGMLCNDNLFVQTWQSKYSYHLVLTDKDNFWDMDPKHDTFFVLYTHIMIISVDLLTYKYEQLSGQCNQHLLFDSVERNHFMYDL